jgi:hypothetical protein
MGELGDVYLYNAVLDAVIDPNIQHRQEGFLYGTRLHAASYFLA